MTDPAGNVWRTKYDLRNRVFQKTDPDTGTTKLTYDDAGQLQTTTDSRNVTVSYTYDSLGRKTSEWQGAVNTGTKLVDFTYDTLAKGQLTTSNRYTGGNTYTTAVTGYDDAYRPLGLAVTIPTAEGSLAGTWTRTVDRYFTPSEDQHAAWVAVIGAGLAGQFFQGVNPVGKR